ncbi:MAG: hypothetical protein NTW19_20775 [Planctomycetota bacterium]|nr:hypothetical protein [Planctomycetota bacterium]
MWPFLRRVFERLSPFGGAEIDMERLIKAAEDCPEKKYFNALILGMIEGRQFEAVLLESEWIASKNDSESETPSFSSVCSRIKRMSGLDPVPCREPREGVADLMINGSPYTLYTRFEDQGDRRIHLRMVEGERAKPPRKPLV